MDKPMVVKIHDVNVDQGGEFQVAENENNTKLHQNGGERVGAGKGEKIGEDEILKITKSLKPIIRGRIWQAVLPARLHGLRAERKALWGNAPMCLER